MKISTNKQELLKLKACKSGFDEFVKAHGDKSEVLFSECLKSNGWDDTWWLIKEVYSQLSIKQTIDLHLLGCDWAESVLCNFESEYPDDSRPRLAIEAKRKFIAGEISEEQLAEARVEVVKASSSAELLASRAAACAAACAAVNAAACSEAVKAEWAAASSAAMSASSSGTIAAQKADLMNLFLKWEK